MEFSQVLAMRRCSRAFKEEQISQEQVDALLAAAYAAPTAMAKYERLHLTVVQNPEILAKWNALFAEKVGDPNAYPTYHAPTVIVVSEMSEDEEILSGQNGGVIMENMFLAATEMGLGGCYLMGLPRVTHADPAVAELLTLPEGFSVVCALAVGYPAQPLEVREIEDGKIATTQLL